VTVPDGYEAPRRFDRPAAFADIKDILHTGPPDAQHKGEEVVGKRSFFSRQTVMGHQQPAGSALFDNMGVSMENGHQEPVFTRCGRHRFGVDHKCGAIGSMTDL